MWSESTGPEIVQYPRSARAARPRAAQTARAVAATVRTTMSAVDRFIRTPLPGDGRRPCRRVHELSPDACRVCWLAAHVRSFQRKWGLPETGGHEDSPFTSAQSIPVPVRTATIKSDLPKPAPRVFKGLTCVHLGALVRHARCPCPAKNTHHCDRLGKDVVPIADCETCGGYEKDE